MELPQGQRLIHMLDEGGNEKLDHPPRPGLDLRGYRHPRTERDILFFDPNLESIRS